MVRRLAKMAVFAVLGAGSLGCPRDDKAPKPLDFRVGPVVDRTGNVEFDLPDQRVRELVAKGLARSPLFRAASDEDAMEVQVWMAKMHGPDGQAILGLHLESQAPAPLREALPKGLTATIELVHEDGEFAPESDLALASRRAVAVLEATVVLAREQPGTIEPLLRSEDTKLVALALEWIRDHQVEGVADAVAELLEHPDDEIVRLAIECLGEIGSPAHAPRMIEAAKLADRGHANRLYEALARVGGPQARGFLRFAARNESDPAMAVAARRALERVRARGPDPRAPDGGMTIPRGHR